MKKNSISRISARPYTLCTVAVMILFLASVSSAFVQERPATGPQTFELRCRGGGLAFNDAPAPAGPAGRMAKVTIDFVAGTQPSGSRLPTNLKSGQCSWVDRGLRRGEPTQIRLQMPIRDYAKMQETLAASDRYWTFQVYNTNSGYLQATRHLEWTPPR